MRKLYLTFPKCGTLSHKLTWSHYYEILKCEDLLEMQFYMKECISESWVLFFKYYWRLAVFSCSKVCIVNIYLYLCSARTRQASQRCLNVRVVFDFIGIWQRRNIEDIIVRFVENTNRTSHFRGKVMPNTSVRSVWVRWRKATRKF